MPRTSIRSSTNTAARRRIPVCTASIRRAATSCCSTTRHPGIFGRSSTATAAYFFRGGIIDQHFSQYRGRLGRLARAAIEERVRYGFGIDEDAALAVATDGTLEVLGPGHVTIVDAAGATCQDGPLGCRISGVHLTCLGHGDRFDPGTGKAIIHPNKQPIARGDERNNGNFQIPDIAGRGAVLHALIEGLGHNTSRQQIGITLKHHRHYGHGYRHTFSKTDQTALYEGLVHGVDVEAVTRVRLDIDPVALTLRPPETGLPSDLPQGPLRIMLEAISFRGIMLADEHSRFRPNDPITRGELASAITRVIRLEPPRNNPAMIIDLPALSPEADEIVLVVAAGLMKTVQGSFRPADSISRQEAAVVLVRLKERYQSVVLSRELATFPDVAAIDPQLRSDVFAAHRENLLATDASGIRPTAKLTRAEVAAAIFSIIDFPWDQPRR